jgi:hypothetical protein
MNRLKIIKYVLIFFVVINIILHTYWVISDQTINGLDKFIELVGWIVLTPLFSFLLYTFFKKVVFRSIT